MPEQRSSKSAVNLIEFYQPVEDILLNQVAVSKLKELILQRIPMIITEKICFAVRRSIASIW